MKFWRQTLLTTIAFCGIVATVLYTSCAKDPCSTLSCQHGGACVSGLCQCPSGYEGTECTTRSITRYLGVYKGYTTCNAGATVADTVYVYPTSDSAMVAVIQHSNIKDTMFGTVSTTPSSSNIIIPDDTSADYVKNITITLNANQLTLFTNEVTSISAQTKNDCTFTGSK